MKTKVCFLFLVAAIMLTSAAFAADIACPFGDKLAQIQQMAISQLNITPQQQADFGKIMDSAGAQAQQIWSSSVSDSEKCSQMQSLVIANIPSVMSVLTQDQINKILQGAPAYMQMSPPIDVSKSQIVSMLAGKGLSDAQSEAIISAITKHQAKITAIRRSDATYQQKTAQYASTRLATLATIKESLPADSQTVMAAVLDTASGAQKTIKANLTPAQQSSFDEMVGAMMTFAETKLNIK